MKNAYIITTNDSGKTWQEQAYYPYTTWGDCKALSEKRIIAVGWRDGHSFGQPDTPKVYRTADGGITWRDTILRNDAGKIMGFNIMGKIDSLCCWLRSTNAIFWTYDGGDTWVAKYNTLPDYLPPYVYYFLDTLNGWVYSYRTRDGGTTWQKDYPEIRITYWGWNGQVSPTSIYFSDTSHGWIYGVYQYYTTDMSTIVRTNDGGINWEVESVGLVNNVIYYSSNLNEKYRWATAGGRILKCFETTDVLNELKPERNYTLNQNYPNPFNPKTVISYELSTISYVTLKVYDILGNEIKTLVNQYESTGKYIILFDARDLPSGTYFYQLKTNGITQTKKMLLLR